MLEDSVFAMLHALGHLDHTIVPFVVVPLCALRSIHLDWVGLVHLHERDARSGRLDGRRGMECHGLTRAGAGTEREKGFKGMRGRVGKTLMPRLEGEGKEGIAARARRRLAGKDDIPQQCGCERQKGT